MTTSPHVSTVPTAEPGKEVSSPIHSQIQFQNVYVPSDHALGHISQDSYQFSEFIISCVWLRIARIEMDCKFSFRKSQVSSFSLVSWKNCRKLIMIGSPFDSIFRCSGRENLSNLNFRTFLPKNVKEKTLCVSTPLRLKARVSASAT